jgi:PAS domain S-box-containing protein
MRERQSVFGFESRIRCKDGSERWISENARVVRDPQGRLLGYEGTVTDVTDRREAEKAVAHERYLLHSLMDHVPDFIYFKDLNSRFTRVNQALAARVGIKDPARLVGMTDQNIFTEAHSRSALQDEEQVIRSGQPVVNKEERETWQDGRVTWATTTKMPLRDGEGRIIGTFGVSRDITERKRAEQALRDNEARYRSLIENMVHGVFLKDPQLRYVAVNKPFCQALGRAAEDILGRTDLDLYPTSVAEKYQAADRRVLALGQQLEEEDLTRGGQKRVVRTSRTLVNDDQGHIVGVQGICWDVTEQRLLEAQLRQAQKMEAVGQLAGGVAHDFNNLLTAIIGNLALMDNRTGQDDPNRTFLLVAQKAAYRAAELTRQLLGYSRRTVLRTEPIVLNLSIDETVLILRRTIDPRITVQVNPAPDLWTVQADPGQMNQVLMNLCLNACDAMPEGGLLSLETENVVIQEEETRLRLEAHPGEFVRLRVRDTGPGMSMDIRQRIFEPFFTTKEPGKGTGLGLAMVFGIVQQHRGWIECHTELNRGTHFDIYLPRHRSEAVDRPSSAPLPTQLRGEETLLVVDDEKMVRDLARNVLREYGYQVLEAEDGLRALDIYQRAGQRIDLVILDLTMPHLSGRDTLRRLIQIDPGVRAILSSGYTADQASLTEYSQILGFVGKPYRAEQLVRAVRAGLDKARRQDQASPIGS